MSREKLVQKALNGVSRALVMGVVEKMTEKSRIKQLSRKQVSLPNEDWDAVKSYMLEKNLKTEASAIRELVNIGLSTAHGLIHPIMIEALRKRLGWTLLDLAKLLEMPIDEAANLEKNGKPKNMILPTVQILLTEIDISQLPENREKRIERMQKYKQYAMREREEDWDDMFF